MFAKNKFFIHHNYCVILLAFGLKLNCLFKKYNISRVFMQLKFSFIHFIQLKYVI